MSLSTPLVDDAVRRAEPPQPSGGPQQAYQTISYAHLVNMASSAPSPMSPVPQSPGLSLILDYDDDELERGNNSPALVEIGTFRVREKTLLGAFARQERLNRWCTGRRRGKRSRHSHSRSSRSCRERLRQCCSETRACLLPGPRALRYVVPILAHVSYTWLGYVFFSLLVEFTSSVYSTSASSQQMSPLAALYVVVVFSPTVLGVPGLKGWIQHNHAPVQALSAVGTLAYYVDDTVGRTFLLGMGSAASLVAFAQTWAWSPRTTRDRPQLALFSGLLLLLVVRFNYFSLNPLWYGSAGAASACVATLLAALMLRHEDRWRKLHAASLAQVAPASASAAVHPPPSLPPPSRRRHGSGTASSGARRPPAGSASRSRSSPHHTVPPGDPQSPNSLQWLRRDLSQPHAQSPLFGVGSGGASNGVAPYGTYLVPSGEVEEVEDEAQIKAEYRRPPLPEWLRVGAAMGSMLFLIHLLFTGHGTVSRWAAVDPYPYSLFGLFALTASIFLGSSPCFQTLYTWAVAMAGASMLCFAPPGAAVVAGGSLLGLAVVPLWFASVAQVSSKRAARTFFVASAVYSVLIYLSLATVAFQWLPPGGILRNRLWVPVMLSMALVLAGLGKARLLVAPSSPRRWRTAFPSVLQVWVAFLILVVGLVPAVLVRSQGPVPGPSSKPPLVIVPVGLVDLGGGRRTGGGRFWPPGARAVAGSGSGLGGSNSSGGVNGSMPFPSPPDMMQVVQLNMQQGFDDSGRVNLYPLLEYLREVDPDVVALQETETNRIWCGNRDAVEFLSYSLEMYAFSGLPARWATWGAALLSKTAIQSPSATTLNSDGELAVLVEASVVIGSHSNQALPVEIFVTHFGLDAEDRVRQGAEVAERVAKLPPGTPIALLGDLNAAPGDGGIQPLLWRGNHTLLMDAYADTHEGTHAPTLGSTCVDYVLYRGFNCTSAAVDDSVRISGHQPLVAVLEPLQ